MRSFKMAAESFPRMTSLIKHSKWRRDLLKGCIAGPLAIFPSLGMVLRVSMWPTV